MITGQTLDYTIENAAPDLFHGVQWLPNNKLFIYLHFPVIDKSKEGYKTNSVSVLHLIGDKNSRTPIFGNVHGVKIDPSFFPVAKISSSRNKFVIGYVANVDKYNNGYYCDTDSMMEGKPKWKKLFEVDSKVLYTDGKVKGNRYYYISPKFSPNYQVLSIDMTNLDFENPKIESELPDDEVVNEFSLDSEGIYVTTTKNGVEASLYYSSNGVTEKVQMPFETGSIVMAPNSDYETGVYIDTEGWAKDLMRYHVKGTKISEQIILAEVPKYPEFERIKVNEIEIESFDGEMVPVSLIYDSENPLASNKPTLIYSYGAYGTIQDAYFSPIKLAWVANGGTIAIAHIRGGGEKGEK